MKPNHADSVAGQVPQSRTGDTTEGIVGAANWSREAINLILRNHLRSDLDQEAVGNEVYRIRHFLVVSLGNLDAQTYLVCSLRYQTIGLDPPENQGT